MHTSPPQEGALSFRMYEGDVTVQSSSVEVKRSLSRLTVRDDNQLCLLGIRNSRALFLFQMCMDSVNT